MDVKINTCYFNRFTGEIVLTSSLVGEWVYYTKKGRTFSKPITVFNQTYKPCQTKN